MDSIEWRRDKWSSIAKAWFRFNEWVGAHVGTWLVADHPEIRSHLARHGVLWKTSVIAYGAHEVVDFERERLHALGVSPGGFCCVIARPEPENSILEIVRAFSATPRGYQLLVLGDYSQENEYQRLVRSSASEEVMFCGAIYDSETIAAIRKGCLAYVHGHTVGGTNPSLVEALGAGAAVIAHDNVYNRGVAGDAAMYVKSISEMDRAFSDIVTMPQLVSRLRSAAVLRHRENFRWPSILGEYEALLRRVGEL